MNTVITGRDTALLKTVVDYELLTTIHFPRHYSKTLKYCPQYPPKPLKAVTDANAWVIEFVRCYNEEHLHSGIQFVTPGSRHRGEDIEILAKCREVYEEAESNCRQRWSSIIRSWE